MTQSHSSHSAEFGELLAAQEPFLRRLSRGMIADVMDADEAVQGTLLAAWAQRDVPASRRRDAIPLRELGKERLRGWLATVLRRQVSSIHRRARPVEAQDTEALVDAERYSVEAIALRTERQSMLEGALRKLPGPTRDAIALRFQDGLSMAEIARLRDESSATVKSRVRRGLAQIRSELERSIDPEDQRDGVEPWLAALLPVAFPTGAPRAVLAMVTDPVRGAAASAAPGTATAATSPLLVPLLTFLVMNKLLVLAVLIVAAGGAFLLGKETPTPTVRHSQESARTVTPMNQAIEARLDAIPTPLEPSLDRTAVAEEIENPATAMASDQGSQRQKPAALNATFSVSGRVLFMDGSPIPGAEVVASASQKPRSPELGRTTSAKDGSFSIAMEGESVPESVVLKPDMKWFSAKDKAGLIVRRDQSAVELRLDVLMVRLVPPGGYRDGGADSSLSDASILTVRAEGAGSHRARVSAYRYNLGTESRKTRLIPTGPAYVFQVALGPFEDDDQVAYLREGAASGFYELPLASDTPELGSVTVTLTGDQVPKDAEAHVSVAFRSDRHRAGRLRIDRGRTQVRKSGVAPGSYSIQAEMDGSVPYGWTVPEVVDPAVEVRAGEDTSVEVRLRSAGMVRLTLTSPAGESESVASQASASDEYMVSYRQIGAPDWEIATLMKLDESGGAAPLMVPEVGAPFVINELFAPGPMEVQLEGVEDTLGPFSLEVLERQYSDVRIELP